MSTSKPASGRRQSTMLKLNDLSHNTGVSMALALVAAGAIWTFARDSGKSEALNNELRARVERLETAGAVQAGISQAMTNRMTTVEAKLDLVLDKLGIKMPKKE